MNDDVAETVLRIVRLQLGLSDVSPSNDLVEDLGAVSADIVNIVVAVEDKYGMELDETALSNIRTVTDLISLVEGR
ncbi:MAG: acyl carrier protein [Rhizobiaceae bacterium]